MKGNVILLTILHSVLSVICQYPVLDSPQGQIVPGIHKEALAQPIIYESFVPLILEYQAPKWNKSEVTFNNWYTCLSEKAPYRYSCPVVFHMNQAMLNLHVDFEGLHPVVDPEGAGATETSQNFYKSLTTTSEFCSKIRKHFRGIWTQSVDIEFYLKALTFCNWDGLDSPLKPLIERDIPDYNYSVRAPFTRMENNFYTTFYKDIIAAENATTTANANSTGLGASANLDLVASALLSNARTTLQGVILGVYYAEKNRWVHAHQDCANQLIPQSIVTQAKFKEALTNITSQSEFSKMYELSIDPEFTSQYYTQPLVDCTHTSKGTFVVRILIPVVKKRRSKSLQLVHIHNLPFQYQDHVCQIRLKSNGHQDQGQGFFQNRMASEGHYLYQELSNTIIPTDCKSNELCQISEYGMTSREFNDLCVADLLTKNHTGIQLHCDFSCTKRDTGENDNILMVTRLHSNKYVLTGNNVNYVAKCGGGKSSFMHYSPGPLIGAVMVDLPCQCQLILNYDHVFLHGEGPCTTNSAGEQKITMTKIIPYHFGRVKPDSIPSSSKELGFYYEDVSEDVLVNLADFVDVGRIEEYLKQSRDQEFNKKAKASSSGSSMEKLVSDSTGSGCSVTSLWVVFGITTTVLFCVQVYILYLFRRAQAFGYPKGQRIVYRVPERAESLQSLDTVGLFPNKN